MNDMVYVLKKDRYSSHSQIARMIPPKSRVLDIGCSNGQIGELVKGKDCYLVGIDNNKEDLAKARYDKKILCDIEKSIPELDEKFNVIIFADILEHLRFPEKILNESKKYLSKNGRIIISLPNIANVYVRLRLLFGMFDYQDRGILDKTHLRFFTLKSSKRFIIENDFRIEEIRKSAIPLELVNEKYKIFYRPLYYLTLMWPGLFGYQFIFKVRPK